MSARHFLSQDVFEDDGNIHLVMELCTGGSILEHLKVQSLVSPDSAATSVSPALVRFRLQT